jgi:hypothetical protein
MATLPLLERHVRKKENIQPDDNLGNTTFYRGLVTIFPEIGSETSARAFWTTCRHGLLDQSTFQSNWRGKPAYVWIVPNVPVAIYTQEGPSSGFAGLASIRGAVDRNRER